MSGAILQSSHMPLWCAQGKFFTRFRDQDYFYLMDTTEFISCIYFMMEVENFNTIVTVRNVQCMCQFNVTEILCESIQQNIQSCMSIRSRSARIEPS